MIAKFAVTEIFAWTLVSVLGFETDASLQFTNEYPLFGTAVIADPLPPGFTVCGVVPVKVPFAPAV